MRTPLMAANWKMNLTITEAANLLEGLVDALDGHAPAGCEVLICPPATAMSTVATVLDGSGVKWGGQNMYHARKGAFTGEISPLMLTDLGCTHVILGHSERRHVFGESDETINKKVILALETGLVPVFAVGEKLAQREAGAAEQTVIEQLDKGLANLSAEQASDIVVAYEPVWAIGTGKTASPADAQAMHATIRSWLQNKWGVDVGDSIRILYGGSVKPHNVDALMAKADIDGALVGGAALKAESFARIVQFETK